MSMCPQELRRRGLNFVRRQIVAGKATKKQLDRWEAELGPVVREIAQEAAPPKPPRPVVSRSDTPKES